jgi:hypothetical protein
MRHLGFLFATLAIGAASRAHGQARLGTVDITIAARKPNAVHVEERYVLGPSSQPLEFRALTRPCVLVENLRIERDGAVLPIAEGRRGPWLTWRNSTSLHGDSTALLVRYDAWLGGSGTLPLVYLAAPLARRDSSRQDAITVVVRYAHDSGRIDFPRMTRQAPNEWTGHYIAMPSMLNVRPPSFRCDLPKVAGDNGGLVWRFYLLIGIMIAWVPIYLLWAQRTGDRA